MGRQQATATAVLVAAVAAPLAWAVFFGDGSRIDAAPGLTMLVVGLALLLTAGVAFGRIPVASAGRAGLAAAGVGSALAVLTGLSAIWSIAPDRSYGGFGQALQYGAFAVTGFLVAGGLGGRAARSLGALLAALLAAVLAVALVIRVFPALFPDAERVARLREPVGYWNALALLAGAAVAPSVWLLRHHARPLRVGGVALAQWALVAVVLAQSRAGLVGLVVVAVLAVSLSGARLLAGTRLLAAIAPAVVVAAWALTREPLMEAGATRGDRARDGAILAVLLLAALATGAALLERGGIDRLVRRRPKGVARGITALVVAAVVAVAVTVAGSGVSLGECSNDAGRISEACFNNRLDWWQDALQIARDHPQGTGARTFAVARLAVRDDGTPVTEPHSVPLQLLADLGVAGLLLAVAGGALVVVAARRAFATVPATERDGVVVLLGLLAAFGVHSLVDYDLDFVAVTGPALVAAGALFAIGRPARRVRANWSGVAAASFAAAAVALVVVAPWLSERKLDAADASFEQGQVGQALDLVRSARVLDPLALEPVLRQAELAEAAGDDGEARRLFRLAIDRQPRNPATHRALGFFEFELGRMCSAYEALNDAYTLDQRATTWRVGGELDQARAAVNAGACQTEEPL